MMQYLTENMESRRSERRKKNKTTMIKDDGDNEKDDGEDQWRLLGVAAYEDE